jgi:hypothetical protein
VTTFHVRTRPPASAFRSFPRGGGGATGTFCGAPRTDHDTSWDGNVSTWTDPDGRAMVCCAVCRQRSETYRKARGGRP